jgi:hypothetical protein
VSEYLSYRPHASKSLQIPYGHGNDINHAQFSFDIVGFDLDGTLIDSKLDLGIALNHALEQAVSGRP